MRWVAIASAVAAITGYVVILIATTTLGAERFELFNVFWGLFFTLNGIVMGLMHETTRGVRAMARPDDETWERERSHGQDDEAVLEAFEAEELEDASVSAEARAADLALARASNASGINPVKTSITISLVIGTLVLATSPLWAPALLPAQYGATATGLLTVAITLTTVQAVFSGVLSAIGRWRAYAILTMIESFGRVIVALIATLLSDPVTGFLVATVTGMISSPIIMLTPVGRRALSAHTDVSLRSFLSRGGQSMLAASAAAVLVVGFPVLIKATRPETDPVLLSNLLLAVTLTRAPILTPITSFQSAIVVYFVDRFRQGRRVLLIPIAAVLGIAIVGAGLAWLVGPPIIELMGRGFTVGGHVLAALTFVAGVTGCLYLSGAAVLARERHGVYVAGWWTATIVAIVVLLVTPGVLDAVVLALGLGPLLGVLVHLIFGMGPVTRDNETVPEPSTEPEREAAEHAR